MWIREFSAEPSFSTVLDRSAVRFQRAFEFLRKNCTLSSVARGPITPMRKTLPASGPKPPAISMPGAVQKLLAHFGLVDILGHADRVQSRNSVLFGNVHAQTHRFNSPDKRLVATAMPLPAVLNSFLGDYQERLAQSVEHGNRGGVMIAVR